jgi:hypothetical protein
MRAARALIAILLLAGCASFKNTPQQDYIWGLGRICDSQVSYWKMEEVRADGSYTVRGAANAPPGWHDYQACMQERMKAKPYGQWLSEREAQKPPAR